MKTNVNTHFRCERSIDMAGQTTADASTQQQVPQKCLKSQWDIIPDQSSDQGRSLLIVITSYLMNNKQFFNESISV